MLKKGISVVLMVTSFCYILSVNVLANTIAIVNSNDIYDSNSGFLEDGEFANYAEEYDEENIDIDQIESAFESIEINLPSDEYISDECISNEFVSDNSIGYQFAGSDTKANTSEMRLMTSLTAPKGVVYMGGATGTDLVGDMSKLNGVPFNITRGINSSSYYFNSNIKTSFNLPGMKSTNVKGENCDGMIPQGITYYNGMFFMTAYCECAAKERHRSVIYVVDSSTGKYITTLVMQEVVHAGGITYAGGYLWIVGEKDSKNIYYYNFSEINYAITYVLQNPSVKSIDLTSYTHGKQVVNDMTRIDYCTTYSGYLCIGDFYKDKTGSLKLYNPVVTASKTMNSIMTISSLPEKAQGAVIQKIGNYIYILISTSWGRGNDSMVYIYRTETSVLSGSVSVKKTMVMPCMIEEVVVNGSYTYMLFESCGDKYRNNTDGIGFPDYVIGKICGFTNTFIFK